MAIKTSRASCETRIGSKSTRRRRHTLINWYFLLVVCAADSERCDANSAGQRTSRRRQRRKPSLDLFIRRTPSWLHTRPDARPTDRPATAQKTPSQRRMEQTTRKVFAALSFKTISIYPYLMLNIDRE